MTALGHDSIVSPLGRSIVLFPHMVPTGNGILDLNGIEVFNSISCDNAGKAL